jgi:hypothetical protein
MIVAQDPALTSTFFEGEAQQEDGPVPPHRQLLPQPVRRSPVQLVGRQDGAALEGVGQGLALERGVNFSIIS